MVKHFRLRGEIISLVKCEEKNYTVMEEVKHCTKELVVLRNNRTYYLQYGSRVVQDYYQRVDCELEDLGNIIQAKKKDGTSIYIMQQKTVREFSGEMHFLAEEPLLMKTPLQLDSVLDYESFNTSGFYDNVFLEAKKIGFLEVKCMLQWSTVSQLPLSNLQTGERLQKMKSSYLTSLKQMHSLLSYLVVIIGGS